jgi:hypothetical protein
MSGVSPCLTWDGRLFPAVLRHMRADRGNESPRWTVSSSEAAHDLLTMAKTLAQCSGSRVYDGSLHVTAPTSPS